MLTFPISTTTTKQALSAINVIKIDLFFFLSDVMMLFIERDFSAIISTDSIIDDFED